MTVFRKIKSPLVEHGEEVFLFSLENLLQTPTKEEGKEY